LRLISPKPVTRMLKYSNVLIVVSNLDILISNGYS